MPEQERAKYGRTGSKARRRAIILIALTVSLTIGGFALASNTGGPDRVTSASSQNDDARADTSTDGPSRSAPRTSAPQPTATVVAPTPSSTAEPDPSPSESNPDDVSPDPTSPPDDEPSPPETDTPDDDDEDDDYEDPGYTGDFPTMDSTGPRVSISSLKSSPSITTERNGQVIEKLDVDARIKIVHDNVTVRDVRINHVAQESGQYALLIAEKSNGSCPENVVIERIEIVGDTSVLNDDAKSVYGECPYTLRGSRIYDVGTGVRIVNGSHIEGNFIRANFYTPGSGTHRSGLGLNGGADHVIVGNSIECDGPGCSGALVMYGDFAQVQNVLIEHNLFNTTGSYCTYAGSLDSKPNPVASNVRYVNNQFGRKFFDTCGRYGPVAGRDSNGGTDFVWEGNVWADTGEPVG